MQLPVRKRRTLPIKSLDGSPRPSKGGAELMNTDSPILPSSLN